MKKQRLSIILANRGIASRRGSEKLIFAGHIKVDGQVIIVPQTMIDPSTVTITYKDEPLPPEEKKVTYILNKPLGYLCSNKKINPNEKLVIDIFSHLPYRLFTVGRLDKNTTGLIFLTNDGHFSNSVIHPSFNITKEYVVKVTKEITHKHLLVLAKGTYIDGKKVSPLSVKKMRKNTFKISVREGMKHEVRKITQNADLEILELKRIRIGSLHLGSMPIGSYRKMTANEYFLFFPSKEK